MHRTLIYLFIVSIISVSCSYFESEKKSKPIEAVDTIVDFNTVDDFPLFPNCKNIPSRDKQNDHNPFFWTGIKTCGPSLFKNSNLEVSKEKNCIYFVKTK